MKISETWFCFGMLTETCGRLNLIAQIIKYVYLQSHSCIIRLLHCHLFNQHHTRQWSHKSVVLLILTHWQSTALTRRIVKQQMSKAASFHIHNKLLSVVLYKKEHMFLWYTDLNNLADIFNRKKQAFCSQVQLLFSLVHVVAGLPLPHGRRARHIRRTLTGQQGLPGWEGRNPDGPLLCELAQSILIVIHVKRGSSLSLIALADMACGKAKTDPSKKHSTNNGAILHNEYTHTHKHACTQSPA